MREYQQGMVSGVRKLSTSWQPGGDYAIPFYHKIYDTENGTSTSPEEVTEVPLITQVYTTQESLTVQPVITYKPKILKPPTPPKILIKLDLPPLINLIL
ncbi:hypothetical protein L596_002456 [Steinernema carpocapsae]|uniref:Uncharacterized protein n=1 Tax=Steinernema carpocapsae TaxID=34508 RepID=A0A4U8UPD1_STECR|nr:hypothetical protein L596_002456 [Steinernema carpocapsae]